MGSPPFNNKSRPERTHNEDMVGKKNPFWGADLSAQTDTQTAQENAQHTAVVRKAISAYRHS